MAIRVGPGLEWIQDCPMKNGKERHEEQLKEIEKLGKKIRNEPLNFMPNRFMTLPGQPVRLCYERGE